jgi:hypothetical protein
MNMDVNTKELRGSKETFEPETYCGYAIAYDRAAGVFYVSNESGYCRGISSLRKDARRWIDMLIAGEVKP